MWCHVLLATPILGLGLFFVLPFPWALGIYLILVLLSSLLYYKIMESMQAPVLTGGEALVGKVVQTDANGAVHWQGEWWTAEPCLPDRSVRVNGLRGLHLMVIPVSETEKTTHSEEN